jgi:hypothetical protein
MSNLEAENRPIEVLVSVEKVQLLEALLLVSRSLQATKGDKWKGSFLAFFQRDRLSAPLSSNEQKEKNKTSSKTDPSTQPHPLYPVSLL